MRQVEIKKKKSRIQNMHKKFYNLPTQKNEKRKDEEE